MKAFLEMVREFYQRYKDYRYTQLLVNKIGGYHFQKSKRASAVWFATHTLLLEQADPEFIESLKKEYDKLYPYLPITYKIDRLNKYDTEKRRREFLEHRHLRTDTKVTTPVSSITNQSYPNLQARHKTISKRTTEQIYRDAELWQEDEQKSRTTEERKDYLNDWTTKCDSTPSSSSSSSDSSSSCSGSSDSGSSGCD